MSELEQLPLPEKILAARHRAEMARIWVADGEQVAVISPRMWGDPTAWGLMLVDLARHVANAYAANGYTPEDALARIRSAMEVEWSHPTT